VRCGSRAPRWVVWRRCIPRSWSPRVATVTRAHYGRAPGGSWWSPCSRDGDPARGHHALPQGVPDHFAGRASVFPRERMDCPLFWGDSPVSWVLDRCIVLISLPSSSVVEVYQCSNYCHLLGQIHYRGLWEIWASGISTQIASI
jgi:hypothetical protein